MPRARGLQLLPVGELVLVASPLEDNEAEAALAVVDRVAQHADEGRDAGHRRDHEMDGKLLLEGEDALRPRTERDRVAHPQRPELRCELAMRHQSRKSSKKGSCGEETIE